jgi:hypothetical protein
MLLAHAPDTAHKEDADHGQYEYSEPNVADHGFLPRSDELQPSTDYVTKQG